MKRLPRRHDTTHFRVNKCKIARKRITGGHCIENARGSESFHVPTPALAFNAMPASYAFSCDFALIH